MCAFAADKFRPGSSRSDKRFTDAIVFKTHRHGNLFQVHADHCLTDVKPGIGSDVLERDRLRNGVIACRCKRAARFRKRNYINGVGVACRRALGDYCAVKMLTALSRNKYFFFVARLFDSVEKSLCGFRT